MDGRARLLSVLALSVFLPSCDAVTGGLGGESCNMESNPTPVFTHHLTDLSLHSAIHPMGAAWGGGITDNGHTYLQIAPEHLGDPMPVYAPVDMRLERVYFALEVDGSEDWALTFRVSCEIWMILTHITEPVEALRDTWIGGPGTATNQLRSLPSSEWVYVQAGDSLGFTYGTAEGRNWDFGVYDRNHRNEFINTARHDHHRGTNEFSRALNSVCPYDFFAPALRAQYEAKYGSILTNQPEPDAHCRQGNRDVPGTVAGTWWRVSGNPSFYGPQAGIAPEFGGHVILGGIGPGGYQTIVESDVLPETVTTSHCWQAWDTWVYLRLVDDTTMHAAYSDGSCPTEFPSSGYAVYER